jgi:hypothetical protein
VRQREKRLVRVTPIPVAEPARLPREGVFAALLVGFDAHGAPLVCLGSDAPRVPARSLVVSCKELVGTEVALMFEAGDPARPLILGRLQRAEQGDASRIGLEVDGERVTVAGEREVVLRCGRASITLTRDGKILLRGEYILSRSAGVNRIKGGSVQIN